MQIVFTSAELKKALETYVCEHIVSHKVVATDLMIESSGSLNYTHKITLEVEDVAEKKAIYPEGDDHG